MLAPWLFCYIQYTEYCCALICLKREALRSGNKVGGCSFHVSRLLLGSSNHFEFILQLHGHYLARIVSLRCRTSDRRMHSARQISGRSDHLRSSGKIHVQAEVSMILVVSPKGYTHNHTIVRSMQMVGRSRQPFRPPGFRFTHHVRRTKGKSRYQQTLSIELNRRIDRQARSGIASQTRYFFVFIIDRYWMN